jgi:hypothetical protein
MAQISGVYSLPDETKQELDRKLIANHFSGYLDLEKWLREEGFEISKSAIHRYGRKFKGQVETIRIATEQARVIAAECDDENDMADALSRLAQQKLFQVLVELEDIPEDIELPKLVSAIATLNRSSVNLKKYRYDVKAKIKLASKEIENIGIRSGIEESVMEQIKNSMLGIEK